MPINIPTDENLEERAVEKLVTNEFLKKEFLPIYEKIEKLDIESLFYSLAKKWNIPNETIGKNSPDILFGRKGEYNHKNNVLTSQHTIIGNVEEASHFLRALRRGYIGKTTDEEEVLITELFAELSRQVLGLPLIGEKLQNITLRYLRPFKNDNPKGVEKTHQNKEQFFSNLLDHRLQLLPYVASLFGVNMYEEMINRDPQIMAKDPRIVYKLTSTISNEAYRKFTETPGLREFYEEVTGDVLPEATPGLIKNDLSKIII